MLRINGRRVRLVTSNLARFIAFYLPQYHPIPENDEWWGRGFTEWMNVSRAKPLFDGHYQPHLPAKLGFYDLRVPEVRQAQADLARRHGIEGFCYWHYWFEGKRLLERPFNEVLSSGQPDFPFCLAWANETWSRRWLGEDKDILQEQTYSLEDDLDHITWLMEAFADPRYIRVHGRPLFLIYKPFDLPDPERTTETFRSECVRNGVS
jgi:lipopolysaccharide biosynthesis protein